MLFIFSACENSGAVDFQYQGHLEHGLWRGGRPLFHAGSPRSHGANAQKHRRRFAARQRVFCSLTPWPAESLSGSLMLFIGPQKWGFAGQGGALGADGNMVKIRQAYLDWAIPDTKITTTMLGIHNFCHALRCRRFGRI